jgi:hypothetical protein
MEEEIDLIEIIRVLWKRKWMIIIPTVLIIVLTFLYLYLKSQKVIVKARIDTKYIIYILQKIDESNNKFTIIKYNKYIKPIRNEIKWENKRYKIIIGEQDNGRTGYLKNKNIYSLILMNDFHIDIKDNTLLFIKDINDFFSRMERGFFSNYKLSLAIMKNSIEQNILIGELNITEIDKKILALSSYVKINKKYDFVNVSESQLTFLPPWQQYTGLKIHKDQLSINLNILREKKVELDKILKEIKKNNINDFSTLINRSNIKKCKYYYPEIKAISNGIVTLKENTLNNILIERNKKKTLILIGLVFMASISFFIFFTLFLERWKKEIDFSKRMSK